MGVFKFFGQWIKKKYKDCLLFIREGGAIPSPDCFLIDANSIFYGVVRQLYIDFPLSTFEDSYKAICNEMSRIIYEVNPTTTVYISIDGVAGLCKQSQQRKRRFKAAAEALEKEAVADETMEETLHPIAGFDTIHFTAGTPYMTGLCRYIRTYFSKSAHPYTFIIDDMFNPGEGEHKILEYIRGDKEHRSFMIYSPDADLIMLSLAARRPNMFVIRPNDPKETRKHDLQIDYYIIHIDRLASKIAMTYQWESTHLVVQPFIKDQFIVDVVLFLFILGNDFLPGFPYIKIRDNGIETLFDVYRRVVPYHGFLVHPTSRQLNQKSISKMMNIMAQLEPKLLLERYADISDERYYYPDDVLKRSVSRSLKGGYDIDMTTYRSLYYTTKFHFTSKEEITTLCKEYFKGLCFVIQYYTRRIPTFDWYYPYSYSPVFVDLYNYSSKYDIEMTFTYRPPLLLTEALFSVIPPSKYFVLPNESLQAKMNILSRTNPMFSEHVETDLSGLRRKGDDSHEAIVILPMVEYDTIKGLLKEFNLSDPDPELFIIKRRSPVSPIGTSYSYTIYFDVQVYPQPGEASLGAILTKGRPRYEGPKLLEYGKYVQFANNPIEVAIVGLNEILLWWIRQKGIFKKRGSSLFLTSTKNYNLEQITLNTKDIQRYKYLIQYIQTELGYRVRYELGSSIESSEIMEETFVSQQDILKTYI
jgi:5'-3' exonuclease